MLRRSIRIIEIFRKVALAPTGASFFENDIRIIFIKYAPEEHFDYRIIS